MFPTDSHLRRSKRSELPVKGGDQDAKPHLPLCSLGLDVSYVANAFFS
jgi:hypothetical protein